MKDNLSKLKAAQTAHLDERFNDEKVMLPHYEEKTHEKLGF